MISSTTLCWSRRTTSITSVNPFYRNSLLSIDDHQWVKIKRPHKVLDHASPKAIAKYDVDNDVDAVVEVEEDRADALHDEEASGPLRAALEDEHEVQ